MCCVAEIRMKEMIHFILIPIGFHLLLAQPTSLASDDVNSSKPEPGQYLNQFAIRLVSGGRDVAKEIAKHHGFIVKQELSNIRVFLLEHPEVHHRSKRSAESHLQLLKDDEKIQHAQQEVVLLRVKRRIVYDKQLELPVRTIEDDSVFTRVKAATVEQRDSIYKVNVKYSDPKFEDMWYLNNRGQSGGEPGLDLNVAVAWEKGFRGKGVKVCILDDGVDHRHPDLTSNYDPLASTDLNDRSDKLDDPMPNTKDPANSHGTRCAGEIAAAANNGICGVGVAYEASIGGIRILDGPVTDALEAEAVRFNGNYIDIYSASWGPSDDGVTMEGPRYLAMEAIQEGADLGRNGLGSIYIWATGNGGMNHDDCNCDGYVSMPETLSVGSVNDRGRSPFFTENCTSTMAVVPSGGEEYAGQEEETKKFKLKVVTTDINGGCIENFQGTSSAAPLASGCVANVLQANPKLTYRDVQHIVVQGTRIPSADTSWTINGAGHHVSHRFGFGLMDCGKMVQLAQNWQNFPEKLTCNTTRQNYQLLKKNDRLEDYMYIKGCSGQHTGDIDRLEHVQVYIKMSTQIRGNTVIILTSPAGTRSRLLSVRSMDNFHGDWEFTFMTVHNWDESPRGKWTLEVHDISAETKSRDGYSYLSATVFKKIDEFDQFNSNKLSDEKHAVVGFIKEWSLILHGTHGTRHDRADLIANRSQRAYKPSEKHVLDIKQREVKLSRRVEVKHVEKGLQSASTKVESETASQTVYEGKLMEWLWNLLHKDGGRTIKKRVLDIPVYLPMNERNIKSEEDLNDLINSLTELVNDMNSNTAYLKRQQLLKAEKRRCKENMKEIEDILESIHLSL